MSPVYLKVHFKSFNETKSCDRTCGACRVRAGNCSCRMNGGSSGNIIDTIRGDCTASEKVEA